MEKKKSTARRDKLIENEIKAQKLWEELKLNESEVKLGQKKFMVTFPYPYMNGRLHMGHAFSLTKAEFFTRYKKMKGFNVLFPFGFHCTGMPICAAAKRLKEELDTLGITGIEKKIEERNQAVLDKLKDIPKITQYHILSNLGVEKDHIPEFTEAMTWVKYFSPYGIKDLKRFGLHTDWRRSFVTTDYNPYYDSFIKWQFTKLKDVNFIKFGKRPSIFSIKDDQMCADHDRSKGEGVNPQEYTGIKIQLLEFPESLEFVKDKKVYLVAATLRPETMYGQTNCFVLPTGKYGLFLAKDDEVYICSDRSALNMAYQDLLKEERKVEKIGEVTGAELIGLAIKAPLSIHEKVYIWPMLSISMTKGTGVVTSVPSDSPDDYAVLVDLKKKAPLRAKFGLTDEQVLPFEPIPIIDVPEYGDLTAVRAYDEFKCKSMNDKQNLLLAKEKAYNKGFYEGIMKIGQCKGMKVEEAKPIIKKMMIETNQAIRFFEPENEVISRSGDECVVSYIDQWYLPYGEEKMKAKVLAHVESEEFTSFNPLIQEAFKAAIDWLRDWGCSRSFGLGTRLPWDEQFLIESLSDSTIYMSYYTVSHYLHSDIFGQEKGDLEIEAADLGIKDWDYVFLNKDYDTAVQTIPEDKLKTMKESFRYWYPLDFRSSGKDLIRNHLTMSLYNHAAVWPEENMMPKSFFCNGWVLVDGKKMSKSEGNFYTLKQLCDSFGADASRLALANAGDTLNDANVQLKEVDDGILKLSALEMWMKEHLANLNNLRTEPIEKDNITFYDNVFDHALNKIIYDSSKHFESLVLREVVKLIFFGLQSLREDYYLNCGPHGMRKDLLQKYCEIQLLLLYPIAPHFCEITWIEIFLTSLTEEDKKNYPQYISHGAIPDIDITTVDLKLIEEFNYVKKVAKQLRTSFDNLAAKKKKKKKKAAVDPATLTKANIVVALEYNEWQQQILTFLSENDLSVAKSKVFDWKAPTKAIMEALSGDIENKKMKKRFIAKGFQFASIMMKEHAIAGASAYSLKTSFNENELLKKCETVILRGLKQFPELTVLSPEMAAKSENTQIVAMVPNCTPGNPQIVFE